MCYPEPVNIVSTYYELVVQTFEPVAPETAGWHRYICANDARRKRCHMFEGKGNY